MTHAEKALVWSQVLFQYGSSIVLTPSDFSIEPGRWVGIMGPNGGGKTTLLKLLMGFLTPQEGHILLHGKTPIAARDYIGYVPQFSRADRDFPITVEEILHLGCFLHPEKKRDAPYWMEKLGLLEHRKKNFGSLSGGLAQKTLLARALISDPSILLLDEPTANIDPPSAAAILDLLASLRGTKTLLLVTHDIKTIVERVDQILCVQRSISTYLPNQVCEHFALGLYHTPLLEIPKHHWKS
jgi:zinc transport system ATP-binding protein